MKNALISLLFLSLVMTLPSNLFAQEKKKQRDKIYVDIGYQSGIGDFATDYFNVELTYGRQATPKLIYGIGTSFRTNQLRDEKIAAVFLNTKSRLISKYKPLLVDLGIGYNFEIDQDFKEGGVLFFAGLHNEFSIKNNLNFYCGVNYDVMRIKRFNELILYRSFNAKAGITF